MPLRTGHQGIHKVGRATWHWQPVGQPFFFLQSSRALGQYLLHAVRAWLGQFPAGHCRPTFSKYGVFTSGVWLRLQCDERMAHEWMQWLSDRVPGFITSVGKQLGWLPPAEGVPVPLPRITPWT